MNKTRKKFWAILADDVENWHADAEDYDTWTAEDAAELHVEYIGNDDDGEKCDVVVSEHRDGRDHKVFRVRVEVRRDYDVDELNADEVVMPVDPGAPRAPAPQTAPVMDEQTLPLFK